LRARGATARVAPTPCPGLAPAPGQPQGGQPQGLPIHPAQALRLPWATARGGNRKGCPYNSTIAQPAGGHSASRRPPLQRPRRAAQQVGDGGAVRRQVQGEPPRRMDVQVDHQRQPPTLPLPDNGPYQRVGALQQGKGGGVGVGDEVSIAGARVQRAGNPLHQIGLVLPAIGHSAEEGQPLRGIVGQFRAREIQPGVDRHRLRQFQAGMAEGDGREDAPQGPGHPGGSQPAGPGGGAGRVVALRPGEERQRQARPGQRAQEAVHQMLRSPGRPPVVADDRVVPLLHQPVVVGERLIPEGELRMDGAGGLHDAPLQVGRERVPHIYHRPVYAELPDVVRENLHNPPPEGLHRVLRSGQSGVVHPDRVVGDVVEVRVVVEAQVGDVGPGRLGVIRRPVGEGAGDAHSRPVGQDADPADALFVDGPRRRGRGEHLPVDGMGRDEVGPFPPGHPFLDDGQFLRGENRRPIGVLPQVVRCAVGDVGPNPVEPLRVLGGPVGIQRRGPQGKLHHHSHPQMVGRLDEGGKLLLRFQPQRRLRQPVVQPVGVADGVDGAQIPLAPVHSDGGHGQEVDGVEAQGSQHGEEGDGFQERARLLPAVADGLQGEMTVAVVVKGSGRPNQNVVSDGLPGPGPVGSPQRRRWRLMQDFLHPLQVEPVGVDGPAGRRTGGVRPEAGDGVGKVLPFAQGYGLGQSVAKKQQGLHKRRVS
jgi:hypothetical protein